MAENCWERPDLPSKCTFSHKKPIGESPHCHNVCKSKPRIANNILDLIGFTPMVRLNRIPQAEGVECEIVVKCEYLNPAGSIKDRIARRMVEEAEKSGQIRPGDILIEPTSGNTGVGIALTAAIKGYRCIIFMSEKMSMEKEYILRGLGAEIVRTRTSAAFDDEDSHIRMAQVLQKKLGPRAHILNQYINPYNPIEHFDQTAEEILHDCTEPDGTIRISMIAAGVGTGGTITGLSRKIKSVLPDCKIVAVDPEGSVIAHSSTTTSGDPYDIEGIGYDFVPTVFVEADADRMYKIGDKESFLMARRLMEDEGLLCGGSSGSALLGAIKGAKEFGLGKGDRVVVIIPDSIRNYMTKHLNDDWMYNRGFLRFPTGEDFCNQWADKSAEVLIKTLAEASNFPSIMCIRDVVKVMKARGLDVALAVEEMEGKKLISGVIDTNILQALIRGDVKPDEPIRNVVDKNVRQLPTTVKLGVVGRRLMTERTVIIRDDKTTWVVSQNDFLRWVLDHSS